MRLEAWLDAFDVRGFVCTHSGPAVRAPPARRPLRRQLRRGRQAGSRRRSRRCTTRGSSCAMGRRASRSGASATTTRRGRGRWRRASIAPCSSSRSAPACGRPASRACPSASAIATCVAGARRHRRGAPSSSSRRAGRDTLARAADARPRRGRRESPRLLALARSSVPVVRGRPHGGQRARARQGRRHRRAPPSARRARRRTRATGLREAAASRAASTSSSRRSRSPKRTQLPEPRAGKPFVDHFGIDLRREIGVVRATFDDTPELARRAGWSVKTQGGAGPRGVLLPRAGRAEVLGVSARRTARGGRGRSSSRSARS